MEDNSDFDIFGIDIKTIAKESSKNKIDIPLAPEYIEALMPIYSFAVSELVPKDTFLELFFPKPIVVIINQYYFDDLRTLINAYLSYAVISFDLSKKKRDHEESKLVKLYGYTETNPMQREMELNIWLYKRSKLI